MLEVRMSAVQHHAPSLNLFIVFKFGISYVPSTISDLFVRLDKNIVRLNISVDVTELMELLSNLNQLNANFEDVYFLEILFVFEENVTQTFTKLVLDQKF